MDKLHSQDSIFWREKGSKSHYQPYFYWHFEVLLRIYTPQHLNHPHKQFFYRVLLKKGLKSFLFIEFYLED